ncbi:MAG: hypothetical protein EA403_08965 [Spirochaetaceae bacterium]|nr:MAG: hypothetical protein EA403_08965 [Spirochaetaceae bacterium]
MDFWDRVKTTIDKSFDTSKEWFDKAKGTAHELGERGVIRVEIMQLESRAEKLTARLGARVYDLLVKEGRSRIERGSEGIGETIGEIEEIEQRIAEKERAMEAIKKREQPNDPGPDA